MRKFLSSSRLTLKPCLVKAAALPIFFPITQFVMLPPAVIFGEPPTEVCRFTYLTEIGMRISTVEATGFPSCIAGKNRHRFSVSRSTRLSSGSLVGVISSTCALPVAATVNRATATSAISRCRRP